MTESTGKQALGPGDDRPWQLTLTRWLKSIQGLAEGVGKVVIVVAMLYSMVHFGIEADPGIAKDGAKVAADVPFADRILSWSFVIFSIGLAELFVLFVVLTVLGKIDLPQAFYDKHAPPVPDPPVDEDAAEEAEQEAAALEGVTDAAERVAAAKPGARAAPKRKGLAEPAEVPAKPIPKPPDPPPVSLARLQAFMWTLVILTIYFHRVVKDGTNSLPVLPPELLMVMGISGATYLISKNINSSDAKAAKASDKTADKPAAATAAGKKS